MRDRLIEDIKNSLKRHIGKSCLLAKNIADDLIADGWIRPPLVMGDKVWIIDWCNEVYEYEVTHISYDKDLNGQRYSYDAIMVGKNGADIGFYDSDIGKYVFLSREEAEKALKGKEDDGK